MHLCNDWLFEHLIVPNRQLILKDSVRLGAVLGDSLPPERYFLTAVLRPNGPPMEIPIGIKLLRP